MISNDDNVFGPTEPDSLATPQRGVIPLGYPPASPEDSPRIARIPTESPRICPGTLCGPELPTNRN